MLAARAALLAGILAASGVFVAVMTGGLSLLPVGAVAGFVLFGLGLFYGHGPLTAAGLAGVALTAGLAVDRAADGWLSLIAVVAIGLAASATLVAADASWWLRRDPDVDPAVITGLAATMGPVWLAGAVLGATAVGVSHVGRIGIWLLPVALVFVATLTAVMGWATRGRHRRHDPQADRRNVNFR